MRTSIKKAYITNNCNIGDFYDKKLFKEFKFYNIRMHNYGNRDFDVFVTK